MAAVNSVFTLYRVKQQQKGFLTMLVLTLDPRAERLELTLVDGSKIVILSKEKVKLGIVAPKEVQVERVKHLRV